MILLEPYREVDTVFQQNGGVQQIEVSRDGEWVVSVGFLEPTLFFWSSASLRDEVSIYLAVYSSTFQRSKEQLSCKIVRRYIHVVVAGAPDA